MRTHGGVAATILAGMLAGCADQPAPSEPTLEQRSDGTAEATTPVETRPIADAETLELSAGVRTAMTRSITAALAELDIPPDAAMSTLNDFFQRVDAQQAERRQARADLPRTIHP